MDASALSLTARQMRDYLASSLSLTDSNILIDHPAESYKHFDKNKHGLNLFFYRVESGGFLTGGTSDDPFYIKMHCLVTAVAISDPGTASAGENDLKLIGGVVASLNKQPFFMLQDDLGNNIAQVQLVLQALNLEELNHIWSTQGDIAYRPSVAYEIGLAPAPLGTPKQMSPRVASVGSEIGASMADASLNADWLPQIKFKLNGQWLEALRLDTGSLTSASTVEVACVGVAGTDVNFIWEEWHPHVGWSQHPLDPVPTTTISDTDFTGTTLTISLVLPVITPGQLTLYATRSWTRPDEQVVTLRSNPLLIVIGSGS